MKLEVLAILLFCVLFNGVSTLYAASDPSPAPPEVAVNPDFAMAKEKIGNRQFEEAIVHLKRALLEDENNADIYNLLGYSHRKLNRLDESYDYYQKALELDPKHRRAHEYLGELYLQQSDLKKAEEQLAILDDLCFWGCKEFDMLNSAIKEYRKKQ